MKLSKKKDQRTVKAFLVGEPGTGKTGCIAAIANAGYNVRILDLDGNLDPLFAYCTDEGLDNIEVRTLSEKLKNKPEMVTANNPTVFNDVMKMLDNWTYTDTDGEEVDLGPVGSWGPKDVLVIDSLTALGDASMRRIIYTQGRTDKGPRERDWMLAQKDQDAVVEILGSDIIPCNVLVTAHLKLVGPPQVESDDSTDQKSQKEKVQQLVPHKYFPSALGRALPPMIAKHFAYTLRFMNKELGGGKTKRIIRTTPTTDFDVKVPVKDLESELPLDSGLLTLFEKVHGDETV